MNPQLENELADITATPTEDLRLRYSRIFGYTPDFSPALVRRRLSSVIQESRLGSKLNDSERMFLVRVAGADTHIAESPHAERRNAKERQGVVWRRLYRGQLHSIRSDGYGRYIYENDGKTYKSPTAIAQMITGTHISGRKFFEMP